VHKVVDILERFGFEFGVNLAAGEDETVVVGELLSCADGDGGDYLIVDVEAQLGG
jgi:hypothetical protein